MVERYGGALCSMDISHLDDAALLKAACRA